MPALVQVQDPVGPQREGLLDAVLDDHDRVALVGQVPEEAEQPLRGGRVEVGERLVDDVQARLHHQDSGRRDELPLPAGQGRGLAALEGADLRPVDDRPDPVADLGAVDPEVLRAEGELGLDGRADDLLGRVLEHRPDRSGDLAEPQLGGRPARDPDRSGQLAG